MLDVESNHQIILLYVRAGLSIRKIAKQLHVCRKPLKTVSLSTNDLHLSRL